MANLKFCIATLVLVHVYVAHTGTVTNKTECLSVNVNSRRNCTGSDSEAPVPLEVCEALGCCYDDTYDECFKPAEPLCGCFSHPTCRKVTAHACELENDGQCGFGTSIHRWRCTDDSGSETIRVRHSVKCCVPCSGGLGGSLPEDCACADVTPTCDTP